MDDPELSEPAKILVQALHERGEMTPAELGRLIVGPKTGTNSNPGTLAASSVMKSLERRGLVRRRVDSQRNNYRTLWRLVPPKGFIV